MVVNCKGGWFRDQIEFQVCVLLNLMAKKTWYRISSMGKQHEQVEWNIFRVSINQGLFSTWKSTRHLQSDTLWENILKLQGDGGAGKKRTAWTTPCSPWGLKKTRLLKQVAMLKHCTRVPAPHYLQLGLGKLALGAQILYGCFENAVLYAFT